VVLSASGEHHCPDKVVDRPITLEYTHHGPIWAHKDGKAYSMATPYHTEFRLLEQAWAMTTSRNAPILPAGLPPELKPKFFMLLTRLLRRNLRTGPEGPFFHRCPDYSNDETALIGDVAGKVRSPRRL
jgi:hypothetical protein